MTVDDSIVEEFASKLRSAGDGEELDVEAGGLRVRARVERAGPIASRYATIDLERTDGGRTDVHGAAERIAADPSLGEPLTVVEVEGERAVVRTVPEEIRDDRFHDIDVRPKSISIRRKVRGKAGEDPLPAPMELTHEQCRRLVGSAAEALDS